MYSMKKLKKIRKDYGYTIYDMGRLLDVTASFYSQLENGKKRLFYDMSIRIADIFSMRPDDLFYS